MSAAISQPAYDDRHRQVGTPKINPTPARPLNSLSSAPTHAKTSMPTEIHAHLRPK